MKTKNRKKKAIKLLKKQGLEYCSTKVQKENGTLYFYDPFAPTITHYSITKSGYIRRIREDGARYQLNRVENQERVLFPKRYVRLAKQLMGPVKNWRGIQ